MVDRDRGTQRTLRRPLQALTCILLNLGNRRPVLCEIVWKRIPSLNAVALHVVHRKCEGMIDTDNYTLVLRDRNSALLCRFSTGSVGGACKGVAVFSGTSSLFDSKTWSPCSRSPGFPASE